MASQFVIFAGDKDWSVARIDAGAVDLATIPTSEQIAADVGAHLRKLGYADEGVMLGLPSHWCLCATVSTTGLGNRARHAALAFRLEEQFPVTIEELTVDFIPGDDSCLGVAVETNKAGALVESLESQDISVVSICPTALLSAQQAAVEGTDLVLVYLDDRIDWISIRQGRISEWSLLAAQSDALDRQILYLRRSGNENINAVGIALPESLRPSGLKFRQDSDQGPLQAAALSASKCLTGLVPSPIELRRGNLAPSHPLVRVQKPLQAAAAAAVLFLICLTIFLFWRASQYDRLAGIAQDAQIQAYRLAFPSGDLPPAITSRLLSEVKRLSAASQGDGSIPQDAQQSALPLLRDTLGALPHGLRYRIMELRIEPKALYVEGQTLDHAAADTIAAALRQNLSLYVNPPHTDQPAGEDVNFTITAGQQESNQ
jgi:hypothetical protein